MRSCCIGVGEETVRIVAGNHAQSLCQRHISIAVSRDAAVIHKLGTIDALQLSNRTVTHGIQNQFHSCGTGQNSLIVPFTLCEDAELIGIIIEVVSGILRRSVIGIAFRAGQKCNQVDLCEHGVGGEFISGITDTELCQLFNFALRPVSCNVTVAEAFIGGTPIRSHSLAGLCVNAQQIVLAVQSITKGQLVEIGDAIVHQRLVLRLGIVNRGRDTDVGQLHLVSIQPCVDGLIHREDAGSRVEGHRIVKAIAVGADGAVGGIHAHADHVAGEEITIHLLGIGERVRDAGVVVKSIDAIVQIALAKLGAALCIQECDGGILRCSGIHLAIHRLVRHPGRAVNIHQLAGLGIQSHGAAPGSAVYLTAIAQGCRHIRIAIFVAFTGNGIINAG